MRPIRFVLLLVCIFYAAVSFALQSQEPSLADAARAAREKKKDNPKAAITLTNDGVIRSASAGLGRGKAFDEPALGFHVTVPQEWSTDEGSGNYSLQVFWYGGGAMPTGEFTVSAMPLLPGRDAASPEYRRLWNQRSPNVFSGKAHMVSSREITAGDFKGYQVVFEDPAPPHSRATSIFIVAPSARRFYQLEFAPNRDRPGDLELMDPLFDAVVQSFHPIGQATDAEVSAAKWADRYAAKEGICLVGINYLADFETELRKDGRKYLNLDELIAFAQGPEGDASTLKTLKSFKDDPDCQFEIVVKSGGFQVSATSRNGTGDNYLTDGTNFYFRASGKATTSDQAMSLEKALNYTAFYSPETLIAAMFKGN